MGARKLIAGAVAAVALGLGAAPVATASVTYNIDTTSDTNAVNPAVSAMDSSGHISLRSALEAANFSGSAATINVPSGIYTLTAAGGAGQGTAGALVVSDSGGVTIAGAGAASTIVDANFIDRAFDVNSGSALISGLTIEHGRTGGAGNVNTCPSPATGTASGGAIFDQAALALAGDVLTNNLAEGDGGAIEDQSTAGLLITGSTLTGNLACSPAAVFPSFGDGGAIDESEGDTMTIVSSTISNNQAALDGGGVDEASGISSSGGGSLSIIDSAITGNTANDGGNGGGVAGEGPQFGAGVGTISLVRDQVSGNSAGSGGGVGGYDNVSIVNTTITGNTASGNGGGVDQAANSATISFSTINANTANGFTDGGGFSGGNLAGGGEVGGTFTLDDSIVTGGRGNRSPDNCADFGFEGGSYTSNGHNLFDDSGAECGATGSDLTRANPHLGALANNGGPTETEALQTGSQAINAADASLCSTETLNSSQVSVDQRGVTRPQGPQCDIGAYEAKKSPGGGGGGFKSTLSISTTVFDAGTNRAWAGTEKAGASAYDTTNLGGLVSGATPTGSVIYSFFDNGNCTGSPTSTDTEPLNPDGSVPHSAPSGPLAAGSYSYQSSYSGNGVYNSAIGGCEPFTVGQSSGANQPDLVLTASPESNPIVVNEQDTVTDTITNVGSASATNVQFRDPAAGFTINSVTPSQGSCAHTATTVNCRLGRIAPRRSVKVRIRLTAKSLGTITLHSSVTMDQPDPTPRNNRAATKIDVQAATGPAADLAISVVPSAGRVLVGRTMVFTLVVSNHGPDAGKQISITNRVPGKLRLVSILRDSQGHCGGTKVVICNLAGLRKGATRRIHLKVQAAAPGVAVDAARATDTSPTDPNLSNNSDQAGVTVVASARPTVGIIHLGASCHPESSTVHIRALAIAGAGIKQVSISVTGSGIHRGVASAPAGRRPVRREKFGMALDGSSLLAGRTYHVLATVTDELGRRGRARAHFTICNPTHRRGFTG